MHASYKVTDRLTVDEDIPNEVVGKVIFGAIVAAIVLALTALGGVKSVLDRPPEPDAQITTSDTVLPPELARQLAQLASQPPQPAATTIPRNTPNMARQPVTTAPPVGSGR